MAYYPAPRLPFGFGKARHSAAGRIRLDIPAAFLFIAPNPRRVKDSEPPTGTLDSGGQHPTARRALGCFLALRLVFVKEKHDVRDIPKLPETYQGRADV
jgi:hypothetical protein